MERDDYKELVDFLGEKFERIDQRFEALDGEVRSHGVLLEENNKLIRTVAENTVTANQRLDRFQEEVREEFGAVRGEMRVGFDAVHERVDRVEETLGGTRAEMAAGFDRLEGTVGRLDERVDRLEDNLAGRGPARRR